MTTAIATTNDTTIARTWGARVLTALPILVLTFSAALKLSHGAGFVEKWTGTFGFQESALTPVAILELFCTAVYAVPRTRILGAILVTGYLGGATVTHLRIGEPFIVPVVLGVIAWLGAYLSDRRLAELVPLRSPDR